MLIIRNVLALIEIIGKLSKVHEHYNCIHNIHIDKVSISGDTAGKAQRSKRFSFSLFNMSISTNCSAQIITQIITQKLNIYRVSSFLLLYARTIIPESKNIPMRMHPFSSNWYMVKGKNILKSDELKHSMQRFIIHINRSTLRMGQIDNLNRSMKSMDFFRTRSYTQLCHYQI